MNTAKRTTCRACPLGCPVVVEFESDIPVSIRGDKDDPIYEGFFCSKGRQSFDQLSWVNRLRQRSGPAANVTLRQQAEHKTVPDQPQPATRPLPIQRRPHKPSQADAPFVFELA